MRATSIVLMTAAAFALAACGDSPLQSLGHRSSEWINEPTVPTTPPVTVGAPTKVAAEDLQWVNDEIVPESLEDVDQLIASIFARRQGDRFIQASRMEIAAVLPDVSFPGEAPPGAEWVSSQLVIDNDGSLSADPTAAFGVWSAEPYTRSRSVAQMLVLKVSTDPETASALAEGEPASCAQFAERATDRCEIIMVGDRDTWQLSAAGGSTLIWFDGPYRYELFARSFIPLQSIKDMSANMMPLAELEPITG
jgi:hypothetical protein